MGGTNPYSKSKIELPKKAYSIRFEPAGKVIAVDPGQVPFGDTGLPGSVLDIAMGHGIELDHACGGVSACSTCHVYVQSGLDSCNDSEDLELDMIEAAPLNKAQSRLACQCVPNGSQDIVVEIPNWNRNYAREGH